MRYLINPTALTVAAVATLTAAEAAVEQDPTLIVVENEQQMDRVPTPLLVKLYNKIRPEKPITKFSDRATANKRMWPALDALADKPIDEAPSIMATKKKAAKKATKKATKKTANGARRGRISKFSGKTLTKLIDKNPRREGTAGHKSWSVIRNGMLYDDYIKAGGRRQDLVWDISHKWIVVK